MKPLYATPTYVRYNFKIRSGTLGLAVGQCCDMAGCVDLFERIDPEANNILVYSGTRKDVLYIRRLGEWEIKKLAK